MLAAANGHEDAVRAEGQGVVVADALDNALRTLLALLALDAQRAGPSENHQPHGRGRGHLHSRLSDLLRICNRSHFWGG